MKKASDAGRTQNEARKGRVSAPAVVTMMASFRFCRMVRLKEAQKKIRPRGSSFCQMLIGGSGSSYSLKLSAGTCN